MELNEYVDRNHAEFVQWFDSGKARRMTPEEATEILNAVVARAQRETMTREQVRTELLEAGIWLGMDPKEVDEWTLEVRPIFVTLEGTLQKLRSRNLLPPEP